MCHELLEEDVLLRFIHRLHGLEDLHPRAMLTGGLDKGLHILREARPAVATARIKEFAPNACIGTHALTHLGDVRPDSFAQACYLIHEADACGQHRVGSILRHLGRRDVHEEHTEVV